MLEELKEKVCLANKKLAEYSLVAFTWGNISGIDREKGLIVIKPSGVPYDELSANDMVVLDLQGKKVQGDKKPSVDTATHIVLYRAFENIGGIAHTHSKWATIWAQACKAIPPYGTTHADFAHGCIPCTEKLTKDEVSSEYEKNTGEVIARYFIENKLDPLAIPAVLAAGHGPFTWGTDCFEAADNAAVLEEIAMTAWHTRVLAPEALAVDDYLLDKHYYRKHGPEASYGQKK